MELKIGQKRERGREHNKFHKSGELDDVRHPPRSRPYSVGHLHSPTEALCFEPLGATPAIDLRSRDYRPPIKKLFIFLRIKSRREKRLSRWSTTSVAGQSETGGVTGDRREEKWKKFNQISVTFIYIKKSQSKLFGKYLHFSLQPQHFGWGQFETSVPKTWP
jgi:hypothetical protein